VDEREALRLQEGSNERAGLHIDILGVLLYFVIEWEDRTCWILHKRLSLFFIISSHLCNSFTKGNIFVFVVTSDVRSS